MASLDLNEYAPLITRRELGDEIFNKIQVLLAEAEVVNIEMGKIVSMTTFCAKQIFGRIYVMLGREAYMHRVHLVNLSEDVRFIIRIGITNAVRESMG